MTYLRSAPYCYTYLREYQTLEERWKKKIKENSLLLKLNWRDHNDVAPSEYHQYIFKYNGARYCYCGLKEGLRLTYVPRLFDKGLQQYD